MKLFRTVGPHSAVIGFVGNHMDGLVFRDWWERGADLGDLPGFRSYSEHDTPDFRALVMGGDGITEWTAHFQPRPAVDEFYAIGSGRQAAMAAMHMGATAEEAVRIAMKCDIYTGGDVDAVCL